MTNQYTAKVAELSRMVSNIYPKLPYHNFNHALDVWSVARDYGLFNQLNDEDRFLLESAALLHDVVYVVNAKDNEEKSTEFARKYLPMLGYSPLHISKVEEIILATKWPTQPKNLLEQIICDADLDNLGREDFFEKSKNLLNEWKVPEDSNWYERQLELLENNHYYTEIARSLRGPGKIKNIQKLKQILQDHRLSEASNVESEGVKC